ncbi:MAG: Mut7-C RNAse domain-containing protein [Thermoplasmata archaeon]|nr:Mut7-C RNAse domain-containing protein [Thermoplasmata archaeon]
MTDTDDRPRFVADSMLGSLARWLRMLGYDTTYGKHLDDDEIARLASTENRHILTRDKELANRPGATYVEHDDLDSQLRLVCGDHGLLFDEEAIRCSACNGDLADVAKDEVSEQVPEGALESNDKFWRCEACGKIYWRGSHWLGILERFKKLNLA